MQEIDDNILFNENEGTARAQAPRSSTVDMQFASSMDRLILPPPEAALMTRAADVPVTHSLGSADVRIPLYEIRSGQLRLPISLSCTTSGIKVDDVSGTTGLGWSLNAGGVITRTICGAPDESGMGLMGYMNRVTSESDANFSLLDQICHDGSRGQLDRYSYCFCGHSGSFVIIDGTIKELTPSDLVIERTSSGFAVTDTAGTRYEFTQVETSSKVISTPTPTPSAPSTSQDCQLPTGTVTAWHLTSITSMDGRDVITLSYTELSDFTTRNDSDSRSYVFRYKYDINSPQYSWKARNTITGAVTYSSGNTPDIETSSWVYRIDNGYAPVAVREISFAEGKVTFTYSTSPISSSNGVRRSYRELLSRIDVKAGGTTLIRRVSLSFRSTSDQRSLLGSVTVCGNDGTTALESYTLDYYGSSDTDADTSVNMQARSKDLFGYWNGKANTTLIPFTFFPDRHTINEYAGDRSYSYHHARALSLKSISTGSGSMTEFSYGLNTVDGGGGAILATMGIGVRVEKIITSVKNPQSRTWTTVKERRFIYSSPVLTIPAAEFTPNRFITTSEDSDEALSNNDRVYYGITSPERRCTVTTSSQSTCAGAPLESALIVYGSVEELVTDAQDDSRSYRTVYTYDTGACRKAFGYDTFYISDLHDETYRIVSSNGPQFHFLQRVPPQVTRTSLPSSISLESPSIIYKEGGSPLLTQPLTVKEYTKMGILLEETANTYGRTHDDVLTGLSVRDRISYNGRVALYPRHIEDFQQIESIVRRSYSRLETSTRTEYHDSGSTTVTRQFTYGGGTWNSGNACTAEPSASAIGMPQAGDILAPRMVTTTVSGGTARTYRHRFAYPQDYSSPSASVRALKNRHYRMPLGEELVYADGTVRGRFMSYTTSGGHLVPCAETVYLDGVACGPNLQAGSFDSYGNPTAITEDDRPARTLTWGYSGRYPVTVTEGGAGTAERQTTTYAHSHLIGVTSMTDPAGRQTSYEYDHGGRLSKRRLVTDGTGPSGLLMEKFEYKLCENTNWNSIKHRTYPTMSVVDQDARTDVSWFDGLGRKVQDVMVKGGGGQNLITSYVPDFLGHEDSEVRCPYPLSEDHDYDALSSHTSRYGSTAAASARKEYEISSRGRLLSSWLPGFSGSDRTVMEERRSSASDVWKLTLSSGRTSVTRSGCHPAGQFLVRKVSGPDGSVTETYLNDFGSPVLERRMIDSLIWAETYYIRDALDRVLCVLPPVESASLANLSSIGTSHCYVYTYDDRGRVTSRQRPGEMLTTYTYNTLGQLTEERTGQRRFMWEYDAMYRPVAWKYRWGSGTVVTLAQYGYDSATGDTALAFSLQSGFTVQASSRLKGLKTWERIRVIQPSETESTMAADSSATYVARAFHYDGHGRVIQTVESGPDGHSRRESMEYNLCGELTRKRETGSVSGAAMTMAAALVRDIRGRVTQETITAGTVSARSTYEYDDLGRLQKTHLGYGAATVNDSYTLQGWLEERSSAQFTSRLRYQNPSHSATDTAPGKAGNAIEWQSYRYGVEGSGHTLAFSYDRLSRLTNTLRYPGASGTATNAYSERNISYDANGNLTGLDRYGPSASAPETTLTFSYEGNRRDGDTYDSYGQMTHDDYEDVNLLWNVIGRVRQTVKDGVTAGYSWLADGARYSVSGGGGVLIQIGGLTFRREGSGDAVFEGAPFTEGRIVRDGLGNLQVHYHLRDHLGSVRTVLRPDGSTVADNDYYPYGKRINTAAATAPAQEDRHTFSGKEELAMTPAGVPYLDFGARFYSPGSGRWLSIDPMAEKYYGIGTHVYCAGNPVYYLDPDGNNPIAGAVLGAGLDVAVQITSNIFTGKRWYELDGKSVAISAGAGALGAGLAAKAKQMKSIINMGKTAVTAAEALSDAIANGVETAVEIIVSDEKMSFKDSAINVATDAVFGGLSSLGGQSIKDIRRANGGSQFKLLQNQLDHAERVAGEHPRASRQAKVNESKRKVENFGNFEKEAYKSINTYFWNVKKEYDEE